MIATKIPVGVWNEMQKVRIVIVEPAGAEGPTSAAWLAEGDTWELLGTAAADDAELPSLLARNPDVLFLRAPAADPAAQALVQRSAGGGAVRLRIAVLAGEDHLAAWKQTPELSSVRVLKATSSTDEILRTVRELMTDGLSERERDIMRLIARGYTNKEIAAKLELSVKSIEKYKTRSLDKLGIRSRAEIVQYAIHQGWMRD